MIDKQPLWKNYKSFAKKFPEVYDVVPETFIIPEDRAAFMTKFGSEEEEDSIWVMKPTIEGRELKFFNQESLKASEIPGDGYIISKYMKPHLFKGFKYDLHLFVLVTSFDPLIIYIYKDGCVKLADLTYSSTDMSNSHHTSTSENPQNMRYSEFESFLKEDGVDTA